MKKNHIDHMTGRKVLSLSELQLASSGLLPEQQEKTEEYTFRPVHSPECCCAYCDPFYYGDDFPDFPELNK